ncbi:MAG: PLP-dependent aminotransferase family protein [Clostridia bacterium]|nr:PLP-dependent aminotransferase family protein [Clostridia bacterium]
MSKKYYTLYKKIKNDIISGKYAAGQKLPSKRVLAEQTGVSVITVQHTYNMLIDEGYITSAEKRGYFVCDIEFEKRNNNIPYFKIKHLKEPAEYSSQPFEYSTWFKTVRKVISENDSRLFLKSPNKGCEILRNAVCDYLLRYRGMKANPKNIIIGSGSEQLYETAAKLIGIDKIFGIESPCYKQIEYVYKTTNINVCKLKMGDDGIDERELSAKKFDVLHVTPFHSYPSGVTTSLSKKLKYIKWVTGGERFIIEDDFDSEFYIPKAPIETLYSMDTSNSVIYINTFSKSLSPAMRMGYMIIPDKLMGKYEKILGKLSCSVPVMDQYILAEFISSGSFERHLNRMRRKLRD